MEEPVQTERLVGPKDQERRPAGPTWPWLRYGLQQGAILSGVGLLVALAGLLEVFAQRDIIGNLLSMSTALLLLLFFAAGYLSARDREHHSPTPLQALPGGALAGAISGLFLALLSLLISLVDMREVLVKATQTLLDLLTLHLPLGAGMAALVVIGAAVGSLGALFRYLDPMLRQTLTRGAGVAFLVALLQEMVKALLENLQLGFLKPFLFTGNGLTIVGAALLFLIGFGWPFLSPRTRRWWNDRVVRSAGQQQAARYVALGLGILLLLALPHLLGVYWADVMDLIGIYVLMGFGLNIVVGYAGLLDLGYVAFFAIGAYTTGYLTSAFAQEFAVRPVIGWPFWAAWPVAIALAALAGVILGIPVLRMRGDYLAIVTLGFGEIIRVLATSDLFKPQIGGAQGILQIPKPVLFGFTLNTSQHLYYLILLCILLAIYVSVRLAPSRVGRAWMAMREDEDVAEAMGINLVAYKLLAFATGAAFAGMSGAIFASKLASIFPHTFNLLWSINVLCLIIVGGMGSIPGVVIGGLILVGLPEVLREFTEYRMLFYGALLVVMMLVRPEGFWPARQQMRLLRSSAEESE